MSVKNIRKIPPIAVQVCRAYTETGELCNRTANRVHPVSVYFVCSEHWSPPEVFLSQQVLDATKPESNQSQSARLQVEPTVFVGQSRMF